MTSSSCQGFIVQNSMQLACHTSMLRELAILSMTAAQKRQQLAACGKAVPILRQAAASRRTRAKP
jgi:hypothetical protein